MSVSFTTRRDLSARAFRILNFFHFSRYLSRQRLFLSGTLRSWPRDKLLRKKFLDTYEMAFVLPWVLKDYYWVKEELLPVLFFCACTAAMIADAARRRGPIEKDTGVLLLWISGNGVWATAELWTPETSRLPRDAATAFLLGGPVEIGTQFEAVALSLPHPRL